MLIRIFAIALLTALSAPVVVLADSPTVGTVKGPPDNPRIKCQSGSKWDPVLLECVPL